MASGNGVSGGSGSRRWNWCAVMEVELVGSTRGTATYRVRLGYSSYYAIDTYANGQVDGGATWRGSIRAASNGSWQGAWVASSDFTVPRGAAGRTETFSGSVTATGGFGNGTSRVSVSVSVPAREYLRPRPPRDFTARRVGDSQVELAWRGDYTGMDGDYPWGGVRVDRRVDGGGWVEIKSLGWAATNFTDRTTSPGHSYEYGIRASGPGGTSPRATAPALYTTPDPPGAVLLEKRGGTEVSVSVSAPPRHVDGYVMQVGDGAGGWGPDRAVSGFPVTVSASGSLRVRVRAVKGALSSAWRESGTVTTLAPPGPPAVTSAPGAVAPVGSTLRYTWRPSHADGTAQTAAQVAWSVGGSPETVADLGGDGGYTLPPQASAGPGIVRARIRTKGLHPGWGAWSAAVLTRVAHAPEARFTCPPQDGAAVVEIPLAAAWEVADETGVASQVLELHDAGGALLHSVELDGSARGYELRAGTYLPANLGSYSLRLTVRGGSALTAVARRAFSTDYAQPARPSVAVSYTPELGAEVTVRHGRGGWEFDGLTLVSPEYPDGEGGVPVPSGIELVGEGTVALGPVVPTESVSVARLMPDGTQWLVAHGLADGEAARDPLPPLETDFRYMVTAYSAVGTATTVEVPACVAADAVAINYGPGASGFAALRHDVEWSRGYEVETALMDFADGGESGGLPTAYTTGAVRVTGSISASAIGRASREALDALARRHGVAWVRDPHGHRALCAIGLGLSGAVPRDVAGVSLSLTETAWREAWDG